MHGVLTPRAKRPEHEADDSRPSSADTTNAEHYTVPPLHFILRGHIYYLFTAAAKITFPLFFFSSSYLPFCTSNILTTLSNSASSFLLQMTFYSQFTPSAPYYVLMNNMQFLLLLLYPLSLIPPFFLKGLLLLIPRSLLPLICFLFFFNVRTYFSRKYIIAYDVITHHIEKTTIMHHRPFLAGDDTVQSAKQTNSFSS